MNTRSPLRARATLPHRNFTRCHIEELEPRLPPGALLDLLGGVTPATAFRAHAGDAELSGLTRSENGVHRPTSFLLTRGPAKESHPLSTSTVVARAPRTVNPGPLVWDAAQSTPALARLVPSGESPSAVPAPSWLGTASAPAMSVVPPVGLSPAANATDADWLTRFLLSSPVGVAPEARPAGALQPVESFGQLPLYFEPNVGQTDPQVDFLSRVGGAMVYLTPTAAVLNIEEVLAVDDETDTQTSRGVVVRMQIVGGNPAAEAVGLRELPGRTNYFLGNDPAGWHADVATYGRVEYRDVYAGIDLAYFGNAQNQLEYDFIVAPGADPAVIGLQFEGADSVTLDPAGDLLLHTALGELRQPRPFTYQVMDGVRHEVASSFVLSEGQVGFAVGAYDTARPLVIDPAIVYSTFLGGSGTEDGYGIAVDAAGSAYVTGATASTNFPTTAGAYDRTMAGVTDVFVTKLNAAGNGLVYSTFIGATEGDRAHDIAVDTAGNAYVVGRTGSDSYPTTANVIQRFFGGGAFDAFATKLSAAGNSLVYSTFLGGFGNDAAFSVAVDSMNRAHIAGGSNSEDYPTTANAYQFANYSTDSFMTKLSANAQSLPYSTFLGGSGANERALSLALASNGVVTIGGQTRAEDFPVSLTAPQRHYGGGLNDGYLARINPNLSGEASLLWATYVGGKEDDRVNGVAVDSSGNAYATGWTNSANFATTPGAFRRKLPPNVAGTGDAYVMKINSAGTSRVYSTFLGGTNDDRGNAIAVNGAGQAFVTGFTLSTNFQTLNPLQPANAGGADAFLTRFNAAGSGLVYSSYLGGSGAENLGFNDTTNQGGIAVDASNNVYLVGQTGSANFPRTNPYQNVYGGNLDAFVAKMSP